MSSAEPPSRNAPRAQPHETKSARDELSSKGKVEKVREIDADEQTRKQRFLKFYKDDEAADDRRDQEIRPSPFDLYAGKSDAEDTEDPIIPSPAYSSPPRVDAGPVTDQSGEDEATEGALPQSDDFWNDVDISDQAPPATQFREMPTSTKKSALESNKEEAPVLKEGQIQDKKKPTAPPRQGVKGTPLKEEEKEKKKEPSLFGPPGKVEPQQQAQKNLPPSKETKSKHPSPFEPQPSARPMEKEEENSGTGREKTFKAKKEKTQEEKIATEGFAPLPFTPTERDEGEHRGGQNKGKKVAEVEFPSTPSFPSSVQAAAMNATTQSAPYLNATTTTLFFQMVGTMISMTESSGVSRTEIVLNNPSFANSRFFGSTITIEKYATAPDSFNIRLTGSQEAVAAFKENLTSLRSSFENGSFTFKVNRLDAEYSLDRPVFRRKEKGEDRGEAGGGDLGERRK